MPMAAQSKSSSFNTIDEGGTYNYTLEIPELADSAMLTEPEADDFSMLTAEQLESFISRYERLLQNSKTGNRSKEKDSGRILSYYEGDDHELTMENLISVVGEVGLSNQLFVLAQAILETGHFTSHVCKEYHNLFGLYDSRHHDYYRFARWEDSVVGYQKFIQYRYKGGNYLSFLNRIGYAEGPNYTKKVAQIAKQLYHKLFPE